MKNAEFIKLKVCGMRQRENILEVAGLRPDYMGFIFYKGSKRFVGNDFILPAEFPSGIKKVGVFVNASSTDILNLADKHTLDFIQLHGDESIDQCEELRNRGLRIIKVFGVSPHFNFKELTAYENVVDFFLFDTKVSSYGGSGISFDWTILSNYNQRIPFFLSGGISPRNVEGVSDLKGMNLHALDVNSGVEREVGLKDTGLIRSLIDI